jgi:integrase
MEKEQIAAYFTQLSAVRKRHSSYDSILNLSRKIAFMNETEIRWDANVWYLEKFNLPESRYNRSKSLDSISFLEITNRQNRQYAKKYMKYELGINGQALSTVTIRFSFIRNFIIWMGKQDICQCSAEQADAYIKVLQERGLQASSFNERIVGLRHFFKFLEVRKYIKKSPFRAEYYFQKAIPVHHDRSVEYDVYIEIMEKLPAFPEMLRCMFLHLWCLGLRASEVCTLKGDAYYRQGREPWMQIYQVKMKIYKRIPIPEALYRIMKVYLKKHDIGADDYIFQNSKGGACLYQTFRHQMIKCCAENGIQDGAYIFQSHDYRHTVATIFYDNEVSIQSIRDYLGHHYEEMTRQYIDYMPKKLAEANNTYFGNPENNLAFCLKKGEKYGNPKDIL